jgi:transposase InsO family protein
VHGNARLTPVGRVHIDTKKLGRIPAGGGWRVRGRANVERDRKHGPGYAYVHSAVDAFSRVAYSEVLTDEQASTCAAFWRRAHAWFLAHGIPVTAVITDNAWAYKSRAIRAALGTIEHRFIRPYRPAQNGTVERFHRTLLEEWAYVRIYRSETARTRALDRWLHLYNHHRAHSSLGGQAPMDTISNLPGHYT